VGSIQNGTPFPMSVGMALCAAGSLTAALVAVRHKARLARRPPW